MRICVGHLRPISALLKAVIVRLNKSDDSFLRGARICPPGWKRMVLLILYFVPFDLLTPEQGFEAVSDKLCVSPVVRTLVFTKANRAEVAFTPPSPPSLLAPKPPSA